MGAKFQIEEIRQTLRDCESQRKKAKKIHRELKVSKNFSNQETNDCKRLEFRNDKLSYEKRRLSDQTREHRNNRS